MKEDTSQLTESPQETNKEEDLNHKNFKLNKWTIVLAGFISFCIIFVIVAAVMPEEYEVVDQSQITIPTISQAPMKEYVEDQIIIKYKKGVSEQVINTHLKSFNATIIKRLDAIQRLVIKVPEGQGDIVLQQLQQDNLIENAENDYLNQVYYIPNDTTFNLQWDLVNTGQAIDGVTGTENADINADLAWDVTRGGVKVAVIDTGIDATHPELSSKIALSKGFYGGGTDDKFGHGTHVAGIIAASTDNAAGIAGVCPNCQLMIAKALDDNGVGPDSAWIEAFMWAADNGAKVINMSFGGPNNSQAKQDAINYAWDKGVVIVAAAGNNSVNQQYFPCANINVICVGASDNKDKKPSFSNYGNWVDVAAPGAKILSTLPTSPSKLQQMKNLPTSYGELDGTSMASPVVAGIAGLVWTSSYGTDAQAVVQRIFDTADKITGTGTNWTKGRVNAAKAVGASEVTPSPTASITPTSSPTPSISPSVQPTATSTPTPTVSPTPQPPSATPPLYCLGQPCPSSFMTPVPSVPSAPPNVTVPITSSQPSSESGTNGTPALPTSVDGQSPTPSVPTGVSQNKKDLIQKIMDLIAKILKLFQSIFKSLF